MNAGGNNTAIKTPIRVAILIDSLVQQSWVYKIVNDIQSSSVAEIVLAVRNANRPGGNKEGNIVRKLYSNGNHLLYFVYQKLDEALFRDAPDPFREVSIEKLLPNVPLVEVRPRMTRHCDYFEENDINALLGHRLDVALRFGFRVLKGRALDIAKYGVWSYHHGDNLTHRGGPPGFWEVMEGSPVTGSILQTLNEDLYDGRVIYRSYSHTDRRSVWRNKRNYYWKSSTFVMRKLVHLWECGNEALNDEGSTYTPYSSRLYKTPTNLEMVRCISNLSSRYITDKVRNLHSFNQWIVAYKLKRESRGTRDVPDGTCHNFKTLIPPKDRFWTDPFPLEVDGRYYVFIEEFIYEKKKGHISVLEIGENGLVGNPSLVLQRDYHLSYPHVFRWNGDVFMIPETLYNRTIELYRCISLPDAWELHSVLMEDVAAVDATVTEINGTWWMFVNIAEMGSSTWDELHLFYADVPLGPWKPHPRNPVKSDVRSARPAGRIFSAHGEIFRPAQDCSGEYGSAISINKLLRIDLREYREKEVAKLLPNWAPDLVGTHTLNAAGNLTVLDARMKRKRWT
jgi:hypothetical protein